MCNIFIMNYKRTILIKSVSKFTISNYLFQIKIYNISNIFKNPSSESIAIWEIVERELL